MGSNSSKTTNDVKEVSNNKELLVLDLLPSGASTNFLADLKNKLEEITFKKVAKDDLNNACYNTKPVLLICNNFSRIRTDIKQIHDLPPHEGQMVLLVFYCVKKNQLPLCETSFFIKDDIPTIDAIVEMGYDCHAWIPCERIYSCSMNDTALSTIKKIDFSRPHCQAKIQFDLVVKLRCATIFEDETMGKEILKEACEAIRQCTKQRQECIVVHGAMDNVLHDIEDKAEEIVDPENMSVCSVGNPFNTETCKLVNILLENKVNAFPLPVMVSNDKIAENDLFNIHSFTKGRYVPVVHGECNTENGPTILHEDTFLEILSKDVRILEVKCFPSEENDFSSTSGLAESIG